MTSMASFDLEDWDQEGDWEKLMEGLESAIAAFALLEEGHDIFLLIDEELETQKELLDEGYHKTVLIRQSTFVESLLSSALQLAIADEIGHELSNSEVHYLEREVNPKGMVHLAYWFGIIDQQGKEALSELTSARGTVAHDAWAELELEEEAGESNIDYERIANRIWDLLSDLEEVGEIE